MKDALLVVDVFNTFDHENGDALLESFRERVPNIAEEIESARRKDIPVIYVNDDYGRWDADGPGLVRDTVASERSDGVLAPLTPAADDRFVLKPRYSAFDHTPLELLLGELEIERILLAGAATEGCIVQSGIDARELGFKVTILADACATNDAALAEIALRYAERVGGIRIREASA